MGNKISVSVIINRPTVEVFASLTDFNKWPQWGGNLVSMEQVSDETLQIGSKIRRVTKGGGNSSESFLEVTDLVSGCRFGIKGHKLQGLFTLEPIDGSTRLNALFEVEATGIMALMYKLLLKQFVMSDLKKFKKLVEATKFNGD